MGQAQVLLPQRDLGEQDEAVDAAQRDCAGALDVEQGLGVAVHGEERAGAAEVQPGIVPFFRQRLAHQAEHGPVVAADEQPVGVPARLTDAVASAVHGPRS